MNRQFKEHIERGLESHGRAVIGVAARPIFSYTIGNHLQGLPELLLICNLPFDAVTMLLNQLSDHMISTGQPLPKEFDVGGLKPLRVRMASGAAKDMYTIQAGQYLGTEDYALQQIVVFDTNGVYQGEPGCHQDYDGPLV